jgi:hypothetical protein
MIHIRIKEMRSPFNENGDNQGRIDINMIDGLE